MSTFHFHSLEDEAELAGRLRYGIQTLGFGIFWSIIAPWLQDEPGRNIHPPSAEDRFRSMFPPHHPLRLYPHDYQGHSFTRAARGDLNTNEPVLTIGKQTISAPALILNTMSIAASEPIDLAYRIITFSPQHAYIEGQDRQWAAELLRKGIRGKILEEKWLPLVDLLQQKDEGPVVTAWSGAGGFPRQDLVPENHPLAEISEEGFDSLPWQDRFEAALTGLRETEGLRICPETPPYEAPITAFDLVAEFHQI